MQKKSTLLAFAVTIGATFALATPAQSNCISWGHKLKLKESVCFEKNKKEYKCRQRNGEYYWDFIQTLMFESSLEDPDRCDHVDRTNSRPEGTPVK